MIQPNQQIKFQMAKNTKANTLFTYAQCYPQPVDNIIKKYILFSM